mgnify:CR=1 FL=1
MKQTTEINWNKQESQLAEGRPVGNEQAQPKSDWNRDYPEKVQPIVRAGLEH